MVRGKGGRVKGRDGDRVKGRDGERVKGIHRGDGERERWGDGGWKDRGEREG